MKTSHKLRKFWHDLFYRLTLKKGRDFALKCQNVTADIDLKRKPKNLSGYFRFRLHLSLCQACKNYYDLSQVLGKAVRKSQSKPLAGVEHINEALLQKYGKKDQSSN